jgi:O-methyltransferase
LSTDPTVLPSLEEAYIELLKGALTHTLYSPPDLGVRTGPGWRGRVGAASVAVLKRAGILPLRLRPDAEALRDDGRAWPVFAHTMVGVKRLDSLQRCIQDVVANDVPGDLIEAGVWRGGASIFMRGVLAALGVSDRCIWVADSFEGLPAPDAEKYPADRPLDLHLARQLAISLEEVQGNFRKYNLLDDKVRFVKGWFRDTLPHLSDRHWSLIRLDGDMYESTIDALSNLYPGLSPGGYLIVDDYQIPACRQAVTDYRASHMIDDPIEPIDRDAVCWRRRSA